MWWRLFLFVVTCQCSFSTCQRYEYLFINESKTWHKAQSYCREKYTDLATVYDMTDMKRLQNSAGSSAGAWIGLYSNGGGDKKWHWSQPVVYSNEIANWNEGEPNDARGDENCVRMCKDKKWEDHSCSEERGFICYDESSEENLWINEAKTWIDAQSYCREHHTDLVSRDQLETLYNWDYPWIGLFRDAWLWSDGSSSSFRHWESFQSGQEQNKCAFLKGSGKWDIADCSESRSFFCYEGQCSFSTCQYHFINESKTWDEAQSYCREKYTDLATVYDMTDMKRLQTSAGSSAGAWIGLYSNGGRENRKWHWSQPGEVYNVNTEKWAPGEPNDVGGDENCVRMHKNKKWEDVPCSQKREFICYDESSEENLWINEAKTWIDAQSYCREHHTDLVSGDQLNSSESCENDIKWWIGLFRDTWLWSDGSSSSFRHWESFQSGQERNKCAFLNESGKWDSDDCFESRSFFCYGENMILIQQNLTWGDALNYCRKHHHDLVSITDPEQQRSAEQRAKKASTPYVWLGLRYSCTLEWWILVSNKLLCYYHNWAKGMDHDDCDHRAAMETGGNHKWFKRNESDKYNFICVL